MYNSSCLFYVKNLGCVSEIKNLGYHPGTGSFGWMWFVQYKYLRIETTGTILPSKYNGCSKQ